MQRVFFVFGPYLANILCTYIQSYVGSRKVPKYFKKSYYEMITLCLFPTFKVFNAVEAIRSMVAAYRLTALRY